MAKGYAEHSVTSDISRMRRVEAAMPDSLLVNAVHALDPRLLARIVQQ